MSEETKPILGVGEVTETKLIQKGIYSVVVKLPTVKQESLPKPGQFYMLRRIPSSVFLSRPISVYRLINNGDSFSVEFLILEKANGTSELCNAPVKTKIDIIGPLGNVFEKPKSTKKVAILGGGIGVAPVASFAQSLDEKTYDFFASFKTGSYGLDFIKAETLKISTEDGSVGTKGILPAIFAKEDLKNYSAVYACGPLAMLKYIHSICAETKTECFLSFESKMACGMGACLGCTIETTKGNKRCCKDGPVFRGDEIIFGDNK